MEHGGISGQWYVSAVPQLTRLTYNTILKLRTSQPVTPQRVPDWLGATPKGRKHIVVFPGPSDNPGGTMYAPIRFPPAPARVREQAREPRDTLTVTTWLTTRERQQVEAANCGCLRFVHRDAVTALGPDLAGGRADAALVSVALLERDTQASVAALVRGFPAHLVAALVSEADEAQLVPVTLELGRVGVRVVPDVRNADGWSTFRRTLDPRWPA